MIEVSQGLRQYLLSLADDEHLMGQRHCEWIGVAPFLEEDLAFASIGRDELGHAASLYALLVGDDDRAVNRLAFRRPAEEYRSCWLVEYETNEWAETLVRHWYYDTVEQLRWELLVESKEQTLAELAKTTLREESFHVRHVNGLLDVLLASDESRRRIEFAAQTLWPLALGQFCGVAEEEMLVEQGVVAEPLISKCLTWQATIQERLPTVAFDSGSGRGCSAEQLKRTVRHKDFERVYSRMREVMKSDPEAVW